MNLSDWNRLEDRPPLESIPCRGAMLHRGDRVRLWPKSQADILDLAMEGKTGTIESIEQDYEQQVQLAVVLDDDPGRDLGWLRQPGHRFFFSLDEVEPMTLPGNRNES